MTNVTFVGYCQYGSVLTNPTLLRYCQYECKAIPYSSSQSSASQELSVLLGAMLICLIFHHQNACQFCAQKSLTAFSASENVSNSTPTFSSTAIFTTNTDYSKTSFGTLCTSMVVTSLCERQGTNWKDSAQIYKDISRTKEITISSKTGIYETVDSWRTKSSCRFNRSL